MQELILLGLFGLAVYYLYRRLVRNRGCNCGSGKKGDCAAAKRPACCSSCSPEGEDKA